MADRILLLVGTKKGAFVLESDQSRRAWQVSEPLCDGWPIQDINVDPKTGTLYAGGGSPWYGPTVFRSDDLGETLDPVERGPHLRRRRPQDHGRLERHAGERVAVRRRRPGRPVPERGSAARRGPTSRACGTTRRRPTWQPGAGGLILHSIVPHPTDPRPDVGRRSRRSGTFETQDGGATWEPRNQGVRACFHARPVPGDRAVRPQAGHGRRTTGAPLPAEPLRRLSLPGRRPDVDGDHGRACRPSSASR